MKKEVPSNMFKGTLWKKIPKKSPHFEKRKVMKSPRFL
jgi:hypothetical protein